MKNLEEIISEYTDQELKQGFEEIVEWRKTGTLEMEGIVRKAHKEFTEPRSMNFPMHSMEAPFLFEIAKRHYENS